MMLSVYHTLFQHYALMFLQELQFTGGKRCFCSYLALRDSVGQITVIQNILTTFRDYDLVALSELYCPSKHRKLTCGWLHGKVKTPESRVMISMLIIFFGIDS